VNEYEINRKVALLLGYRIYEIQFHKQGLQWDGHIFQIQKQVPEGVEWYKEHTLESWQAIRTSAPPGQGALFGDYPDFCTNPASADQVRLEIERRGWEWFVGNLSNYMRGREGKYYARVENEPGSDGPKCFFSDESPHHALCLAFLAAHEATEAQGVAE
jgi:hypothetical protein